jgi:hypothetical protein
MASTYSALKIQLMATGENSGTWGNVTNVNLGTALEEAIVGSEDVTFASGNVTLTLTDTNATQTARNLRLNLTGTTAGARDLIVPAIEKVYIVNNGTADTITVKNTTGTGIAVPTGKTMYVYNTGTNVVDAITHLTSLTLASALPIASGGTGSTTATFSGANITSLNASSISSGTLDNARTSASSSNGANTIVLRGASGQFSAGTITGTLSGTATQVSNSVTFNNSGGGGASGSTFNGSGALTVSYNTVGAPSTGGTGASGTWSINVTGSAGTATTASTANALNTGNNYQVNSLGVGTGASGTAGEIRATNNVTAFYSDKRLKDIAGPIDNALNKISKIRGVYYTQNKLAESYGYNNYEQQVGVIAQEIKEVLPEAVKFAPFDREVKDGKEVSKSGEEYLTVQYEKLVPLLIEAIKELSVKVEKLGG